MVGLLPILGIKVIENLELGSGLVGIPGVEVHPIENAAVAALADFPLQAQFEVAELVLRDEIAGTPERRQHPVIDAPSVARRVAFHRAPAGEAVSDDEGSPGVRFRGGTADLRHRGHPRLAGDRKSTRLNSSHQIISYAVFCLKKK